MLAGPAFPSKSDCVVKRQETGEYQGLLVSKILVDCLAELHSEPAPLECIQLEIASGSTFQYKLSRLKSIEDTPIQMQTYNRETGIAGDWEDIKSPATASSLTGGECLRFRAKPSDDYMN